MTKKIIALIAFAISNYYAVAQTVSIDEKAEQNITQSDYMLLTAVGEMTIGNMRGAYDILEQLKRANPQNSTVHYYLAKSLQSMGRTDQATQQAAAALEIDSTSKEILSLNGQLLIEGKEYPKAQQIFEQLIAQYPADGHNYLMACALALEQRRADQALALANKYEEMFGIDEKVVELKRASLMTLQRYYDALEYMQRAVDQMPTSLEYILSLGDINAGLGLDKTAVELYERGFALDSTRADGLLSLAKFYEAKNNEAQYIATLDRIFAIPAANVEMKIKLFESSFFGNNDIYRNHLMAIRRAAQSLLFANSENVAVRLLYGRFLTYIGQIEEAKIHYTNMLEAGVDDRELFNRLMEINFYFKNYADVLSLANRALGEWPGDYDMVVSRITAMYLGGNADAALKEVGQAIKLYRSDSLLSSLYALTGDIEHELGRDKKAFAAYERSLRYNPDNALVLNNYAYFLSLTNKNLDQALEMATKACELMPNFSTYLDTKAWVLFKMGKFDTAAQIQQRALACDRSGSAELLLHYGDILYALGDDLLARSYWKKALEAGSDATEIETRLARPRAIKPTL